MLSAIGVETKESDEQREINVTFQGRVMHWTDHPARPGVCRSAAWVVIQQAASERSEGCRRRGDEYMLAFEAPTVSTVCRSLSPPPPRLCFVK